MFDLATRLATRVQLTTDAFGPYRSAVAAAFAGDVDFAQVKKTYVCPGQPAQIPAHQRYSPSRCTGMEVRIQSGDPDRGHISTSYVERQNLTIRMGMRRFTRLTNGFSKKLENLVAAVSLHFMQYNFVRVHKTLGTTPAVAAGIADHVWSLAELIGLLDSN